MRRFFAVLLVSTMLFGLCACANTTSNNSAAHGPSQEDLCSATDLIKQAYDDIIYISNELVGYWPYINRHYSTDSSESDSYFLDFRNRFVTAKKSLTDARELLGANGTGEHYEAVKHYYTQVQSFFDFVSVFPEGYSKDNFTDKVSDYKQNCTQMYNNAIFFE